MFLQEEYFARHNLNAPVINHVREGSVFLKMDSGLVMMKINWQDVDRHPGFYIINYFTPIHDGCDSGMYWRRIDKAERKLQWEEYQPYFLSWAKGHLRPIFNRIEVVLAGWQIFVFCADNRLASLKNKHLESLIYLSLDSKSVVADKFAQYQKVLAYLCLHHGSLLCEYTHQIVPHIECYCYWLVDLIKKNEYTK